MRMEPAGNSSTRSTTIRVGDCVTNVLGHAPLSIGVAHICSTYIFIVFNTILSANE